MIITSIGVQPIKPITFSNRSNTRIKYDTFTPTYDTFTGMKDKNTLLIDLGRRMYRKEDVSIGMFDMDNFKSVNELLGYKVGDEFIKTISEDISTVARKHKVDSYRFGGDEFVVLLFNGKSKKEKLEVVQDILDRVSNNPNIQGQADNYMKNANSKLSEYEDDNNKTRKLLYLNMKRDILQDVVNNSCAVDPYVLKSLDELETESQKFYSELIQECLSQESDKGARKFLSSISEVRPENRAKVDEYLIAHYDKNAEEYRLKKWINDFNKNGFNLSGGIVNFQYSYYRGKQPIDLINNTGEYLKSNKSNKGRPFYVEV